MHRIILDTDLGMGAVGSDIDDGFALALATADPDITVEAVTTVNGNTDVESATLLSVDLLRRLGTPQVPVYKGAATPLTRPDKKRQPRPDVLRDYGSGVPAPGYAAAQLARRVMAEPGELTIVGIGPLTNLATAMALEPGLPGAVREIVMMGGVFTGQTGQAGMPGEFNIWIDPEAAEAVLHSGAPLRFVGLDVTLKVRLTRAHAARLAGGPAGSFSSFAGQAASAWIDHMHADFPGDALLDQSCAMHDPLAVAVVAHPELVTWRPAHVAVVTGDGVARGVTVTDLLTGVRPPQANCQIATDVDVDAFMSYFVDTIGGGAAGTEA